MSADLATGNTPSRQASASHTKGGLSLHMAPTYAPTMGTRLNPEQYRTRKVALITGKPAFLFARGGRESWNEGSVLAATHLFSEFHLTEYTLACLLQVSLVRMVLTLLNFSSRKATRFTDCKLPNFPLSFSFITRRVPFSHSSLFLRLRRVIRD